MSVVYSSHAVIGLQISNSVLTTKVPVRGCSHEDKDTEFCPKCGGLTWITEDKAIDGYDEISNLYKEYRIVLNEKADGDGELAYIALLCVGSNECNSNNGLELNFSNLPEHIETFKSKIPKEIWDEGRFGFWSCLHSSY